MSLTSVPAGPLVLMYHRVGTPARRSPVNGQYVGSRAFAQQMEVLRRTRTAVVPLEAVARHVRGEESLSSRHIAITFDDGFANLYFNAFPVLRRLDFTATVFLISQFIGKTNSYHPPDQDLVEPLLSADQIMEMHVTGIHFGSHTRNHARLTTCNPDQIRDEIAGSRADLEDLIQQPVTTFCYPYGAQDLKVREAVIQAGYTLACSTLKGRNDRGCDPYQIRRINIRADTSLPVFLYKLARARRFNR